MEEVKFSTSYVPLQPPYQIIKYGHDIGMQIGTLIATKQIEGDERHPFRIESHSYPVVAYENKLTVSSEMNLFSHNFMEGAVWNRTELRNVSTICLSNSHLSWAQFISILWSDHYRAPSTQKIQKRIFKILPKYGVNIDKPIPDDYTIHLIIEKENNVPVVVRSKENDVFALNIEWDNNIDVLEGCLVRDLTSYLDIISPKRFARGWHLNYETNDEELKPLVEKLNVNRKATSFHRIVVSSFVVSAIIPYEDETTDEDKRAADLENLNRNDNHGAHYYGKDCEVFHPNIDTTKVASEIIKLDRFCNSENNTQKKLGNRQFARVLYEMFKNTGWLLGTASKRNFVDWLKHNCQIYFEDQDCGGDELSLEMKKKIEEYADKFTIKQANGVRTSKRDLFFKKDKMGNPLAEINTRH